MRSPRVPRWLSVLLLILAVEIVALLTAPRGRKLD
jgi:hypothetical protein